MALSKRLALYSDVHAVLEACVTHGGGRITLPTKGKAQNWRMRANYYRKLLHDEQERRSPLDDPATSTPYDGFVFGSDPDAPCVVVIAPPPVVSTFTAPDGTAITLESTHEDVAKAIVTTELVEEEDGLLGEALDFAKTLTGGEHDG